MFAPARMKLKLARGLGPNGFYLGSGDLRVAIERLTRWMKISEENI